MGAPRKLRFQKMKLDLSRPVVCMLHYFWNFARNFLVFPGGHIQTKQKRFSPITLLKGTVMGYFLPISAYCYSFMFFYFLKTSTFSYPIWHRCSCYTLTVTIFFHWDVYLIRKSICSMFSSDGSHFGVFWTNFGVHSSLSWKLFNFISWNFAHVLRLKKIWVTGLWG